MRPSFDAWMTDVRKFMSDHGWVIGSGDDDVMIGLRSDYDNGRCALDAAQDLLDAANESLNAS